MTADADPRREQTGRRWAIATSMTTSGASSQAQTIRVAQDQAPLGVGVVDLDPLAAAHVRWQRFRPAADRRSPLGMFSAIPGYTSTLMRSPGSAVAVTAAMTAAARHVGLHVLHPGWQA
jgi:hypothetical protein